MSLTTSVHTAFSSIRLIEAEMSTVSSNVANADKAGYTRKTVEATYSGYGGITVPTDSIVIGSLSKELNAATISDYTDYAYKAILADYLDRYSSDFGSTSGSSTLSSNIDDLYAAITQLASTPEDDTLKTTLVSAAGTLASTISDLSDKIQDYRTEAEQAIGSSIDTINETLSTLDKLNKEISTRTFQGLSTADLEDERMAALTTLNGEMGVSYYFNSDNELRIFTTSGLTLLDSQAHLLSHDTTINVSTESTYPSTISGLYVDGKDITTAVKSGTLGGLIELRDTELVAEQEKLDALASALITTVNTTLADGASFPAASSLTSQTSGWSATDSLSATGTLRIATVDEDGMVQSFSDLDLSSYATLGDLVSALDAVSGVSASLDVNGKLTISAEPSGQGIAMNQMDSDMGGGTGFVTAMGFNNLFVGTNAASIAVPTSLQNQPEYLATSLLTSAASLTIGTRGISDGDGTIATALEDSVSGKISFSAAGGFVAQNNTLSAYAAKIIDTIASKASTAQDNSDTADTLYRQGKELLDSQQGVNVDEETVRLTELQNQYQSAATVIQTVQEMFNALIDAIN